MKKLAAALICATMCLSCVATASAETVKIGVFEPASGDNGAGGKQETLGISMQTKRPRPWRSTV